MVVKVYTTSSAVSGEPSEKVRPSRSLKMKVVGSGFSQLSARSGTASSAGVMCTRPE
ncbi:hypothetical protein D3C78_1950460 [compost metagenome]